MAKKKRFYAIKKGKRNVRNKIVGTWSECKELVLGYPAEYKGFATREEAEIYLGIRERELTNNEIILMPKLKNEKARKKKSKDKNNTILEVELSKDLYKEFSDKCSNLGFSENDIIVDMIKEWLF